MRTTTPTHAHVARRRVALLVAPALALVITAACGSDDPVQAETAVLGDHVERSVDGIPIAPADRPVPVIQSPDPRLVPRRAIPEPAESPDPRLVPRREVPDRTPSAAEVSGARYAAQAEATYEAELDAEATRPVRVNGGRTEA